MPAIKYGIDDFGRKVAAKDAYSERTYRCYYCKAEIYVCKGNKNTVHFRHKSISNRTPQQRACEGYKGHGASDGYIKDYRDRLYIYNGGVPVHLTEVTKGKYELIAMFPPLSNDSLGKLADWDAKVKITCDGRDQGGLFSAWNLRRYRIKTTNNWIDVQPQNFKYDIDEIKRKWLWGIKGISFDDDLFRVDATDGVRVASMGNIVVGKEYLFVHRSGSVSNKNGLEFEKKGTIFLSDGIHDSKKYDVYSVVVNKVTEDSTAYIQSNGYNLIKETDDLIPMWPPAVIEGKEIIYQSEENTSYLYHEKISNQLIFQWNNNTSPRQIQESEDLIKCSTNNNVLLVSDYSFNSLAKEIRFILTQERNNFERNRIFEISICFRDDAGNVKELEELLYRNFGDSIITESNYSKTVILNTDGLYVNKSSQRQIRELLDKGDIWLDYLPFGRVKMERQRVNVNKPENKQTDEFIKKLYQCKSAYIPEGGKLNRWIVFAKEREEKALLQILYVWKNLGSVPSKALMILNELEET